MTQPKVSILMNCYNSGEYLQDALQSVLSQSYQNWEIIFIDNQSTDDSAKIVKSVKDQRVKYYKTPQFMTLYQARAYGQKFITGDYLGFLDCDDIWKKHKLKTQIQIMEKDNIQFLHGRYDTKYEGMHFMKREALRLYQTIKQMIVYKNVATVEDQLMFYDINLQTVLFKVQLMDGISFRPEFNLFGDLVFFIELAKKNSILFYKTRISLATTRIHSKQLSKRSSEEWVREADACEGLIFQKILSESEIKAFSILKSFYKSESFLFKNEIEKSLAIKREISLLNPAYLINYLKTKFCYLLNSKK